MQIENGLDRMENRWRYFTSVILIVFAVLAVRQFVKYGASVADSNTKVQATEQTHELSN